MQALMLPPQCPPHGVVHDAGGPYHRRSCSDLPFRVVPADLGPDSNPFSAAAGVLPDLGSEDDLFHMYLDKEKVGAVPDEGPDLPPAHPKHRQSLSVGGLGYGSGEAKKAMAPEKLAELAIVDPKRVKRILANRQSAARSKERKARYISELERKVQAFQIEITTLSARLAMVQRDTTGLATENNELKLRLQVMEQQSHLHDALNVALKNEVERLKFATGEAMSHPDAYNMQLQHFPFHHQPQQQQPQIIIHQNIPSPGPQFAQPQQPHPQFYQPPQPQPQFCQPQPDFSNQQMLDVEQSHDHGFTYIDQGLQDMMMPQEQLGKMPELDICDISQIMQPTMEELDVSNDSDMLQPEENCTFSPCESSNAF